MKKIKTILIRTAPPSTVPAACHGLAAENTTKEGNHHPYVLGELLESGDKKVDSLNEDLQLFRSHGTPQKKGARTRPWPPRFSTEKRGYLRSHSQTRLPTKSAPMVPAMVMKVVSHGPMSMA